MTRSGKLSGALTATCGALVALWALYAGLTADAVGTGSLVARGLYAVGGVGMAAAGLGSVRYPDPDESVQRSLTRVTFGSLGLILLGVGLVTL